jgi:hypothetical protein
MGSALFGVSSLPGRYSNEPIVKSVQGRARGNVTPSLFPNAKVHLFCRQTFVFTVYPA